jgi:hypothetical protein
MPALLLWLLGAIILLHVAQVIVLLFIIHTLRQPPPSPYGPVV